MALSGGRLAFERAIRRSRLPAPARHVALTIATWADVGSGVIPERFQPSLSTIAEATGLGVSTVKRHLVTLEAAGWLLRDRPEIARAQKEHARTKYELAISASSPEHGPERAMPSPERAMGMTHGDPRHGSERAKAGPRAGHKSSLSTDESPVSTSSSVAELSATEPADPPDGGGGGGDLSSRFTAQEITTALDYRGKQPDKRQQQTITDRLAAALDSGWTVDGLALYLDLGAAAVDSPAAVYAHRLKPGVLPDAEPVPAQVRRGGARGEQPTAEEYESLTIEDVLGPARPATGVAAQWQEASRRAQDRLAGGTDSTVAGWAAVSRQLAAKEPHRPYTNDAWSQPAIAAEIAAIPHCEDSACDPKTRLRDYEGEDGLKYCSPCEKCHPRMQWG